MDFKYADDNTLARFCVGENGLHERSCMLFSSTILGESSPRRNFSSDSFNAAFILSCFAFSSASFFRLLFSVFEIFWSSFLFSTGWLSSAGSWLKKGDKGGGPAKLRGQKSTLNLVFLIRFDRLQKIIILLFRLHVFSS